MERDQSEPSPLGPMPQRADLSALRRTHHERLQAEFAKAGVDFSRLEKLYNEYKEEARKLLEEHMPSVDSKPVKQTKGDKEWIQNKKRVYELTAGSPLILFTVVVDTPVAIYSIPSGALLSSHIESWNSWARWSHQGTQGYDELVFLKFLFAWQNNSLNPVVVKNASADLSVRGRCQVQANPPLILYSLVQLFCSAYHRVHVGTTSISGDRRWLISPAPLYAYTPGYLWGGSVDIDARDLDLTSHVRCQDIVVPSGSVAIFEVGVEGFYSIRRDGRVHYLFAGSGRRIACPSLVLELSLVVQS